MSDSSIDSSSYDSSQERVLFQNVIASQNYQMRNILSLANLIFEITEENLTDTCAKIIHQIKENKERLNYFINLIYYSLKVRPKNTKTLSLLITFLSKKYDIKKHLIYLIQEDNAIKEKNFQRRLLFLFVHQDILTLKDVNLEIDEKKIPLLDSLLTIEERGSIQYYLKEDSITEFQNYINNDSSFDFKKRIEINSESYLIFITHSHNIKESMKNEISMLCFTAFYGSIKCFKYLLLNGCDITDNLGNYAIAGANCDIIHYLEETQFKLDDCFLTCIRYHRNQYIDWLMDRYDIEPISLIECLQYCNEGYLLYCLETIEDLEQESIKATLNYAKKNGFVDMIPILSTY